MGKIYTSAEQLIGGTPLLELTHLERELGLSARILGKLESFNPGGSAKDRIAKSMLDDGEARGILKSGSVIIEPTSGNTGIGLALVAAARGQKTVLDLYGELVAAQDARESLQCGNHALYACCPQLWDSRLQEELGCKEDPMQVLDKLFSLAEQDQLGGQALRFLGLLPGTGYRQRSFRRSISPSSG